jgi:lipopolysaccharide transport system ATP-binding protein
VFDGEVLGIIGPNGAGKSTLLKIISRVTTPTKGIIKVKGKISSLLEVGTGFHPELTGRENIYLNGAINGMGRKEVSKKLDAIVDFAGVETFLDTPVKRYSSGMHVRLGFAVAAHLEPDILIVDEVLAVGDAAFQKKAINKMEEVSQKSKRTVLFVSHNMNAVKNFCTKTILLHRGEIIKLGKTEEVINFYSNQFDHNQKDPEIRFEKNNNMDFQILGLSLVDKNKQPTTSINRESSFSIVIEYIVKKYTKDLHLKISLVTLCLKWSTN